MKRGLTIHNETLGMAVLGKKVPGTAKQEVLMKWKSAALWIIITVVSLLPFQLEAKEEQATENGERVSGMVLPVSHEELMEKVTAVLSAGGGEVTLVKTVSLGDLGRVYVATIDSGKKRIFARVVARRVPCMDCHDVFFVYSFDEKPTFLDFAPLHVTKRYNKPWDTDDIAKIQTRLAGESLSESVPFNPMVDAVSYATISSKLVFHSINQTDRVLKQLGESGSCKGE